MKKFLVIRQGESDATTVTDEVEADYILYPMGVLIFKREALNRNSYPDVVRMYAPGVWRTVILQAAG